MELNISVEERKQSGKGPARQLRMAGKVPGVLYGLGDHKSLALDPKFVQKILLQEGGKNTVLTVKGAGIDGKKVLIKDYQIDPVANSLLHVDLLEIDVKEKVEVTVALNFTGKSKGVVEGGILNIIEREVPVSCFPDKIPQHIDVDVTPLIIGESFHFDDLTLPEGLEKAGSGNPTIVTVVPPAKEEELEASLQPGAEPEVITEKKDAEGAEGAAAGDKKDAGGEKKDK